MIYETNDLRINNKTAKTAAYKAKYSIIAAKLLPSIELSLNSKSKSPVSNKLVPSNARLNALYPGKSCD